jgi:hypothetical protein
VFREIKNRSTKLLILCRSSFQPAKGSFFAQYTGILIFISLIIATIIATIGAKYIKEAEKGEELSGPIPPS